MRVKDHICEGCTICIEGDESQFDATGRFIDKGNAAIFNESKYLPVSYTIGLLRNYLHPEIVVCGLTADEAFIFLDPLRTIISRGKTVSANVLYSGFVEGNRTIFKTVDPINYLQWIGYSNSYYQHFIPEMLPYYSVLQMVLVDYEGRLPWEPGYLSSIPQPFLWEPQIFTNHNA